MLGHIAIAALGGCFSQNPDTGAAEATYFPAESVTIAGRINKSIKREAGTTDFNLGFTDTRFWVKLKQISWTSSYYPEFVGLGETAGNRPRTMVLCGLYPSFVSHMVNENSISVSTKLNPSDTWICRKESGDNYSEMTDGIIVSRRATTQTYTFGQFDFYFSATASYNNGVTVFFGDLMSNKHYGVQWRRLPMRCTETNAVAIYEADAKTFTEY